MTPTMTLQERLRGWRGLGEATVVMTRAADELDRLQAESDALAFQRDGANETAKRWRQQYVAAVVENEVLRAAVSAERERCARLCAEMGAATWWPNEERDMADLLRKMILDGREHARDAKEQKP